jgi:hypothetical protein
LILLNKNKVQEQNIVATLKEEGGGTIVWE